jgi:hypothetical protein
MHLPVSSSIIMNHRALIGGGSVVCAQIGLASLTDQLGHPIVEIEEN